jgi:ankyrin repeat protein
MNEFYAESFMIACEKGNMDEAKRMVSQGVDLNHIDKSGNNGYFQASKSGQLHILHYLLENEAILVDVVNKDECTPLHQACDLGKRIISSF